MVRERQTQQEMETKNREITTKDGLIRQLHSEVEAKERQFQQQQKDIRQLEVRYQLM